MSDFQPTARLLLALFRAFERELLHQLASSGITDVTPSHLNIIRHLDNNGMMISRLAQDAALSKQLVGRIVKELEAKGYLKVTPDPVDRRIKYVRYTSKGSSLIANAVEIVSTIEQRYESELGSTEYHQFRNQLNELIALHSQSGIDDESR